MNWQQHDTATSHFLASSDQAGLRLHLRAQGDTTKRLPVLFVHGATYASRLYDIPHPGASWLKAAADAGFAAYALDIRGYGKSHVSDLERQPQPYARGADAVVDISDAVTWILKRHDAPKVSLIGGSWGSITTAMYAAGHGGSKIKSLVLYAPIFAEKNPGWLSYLADAKDPNRFNPAFNAARLIDEATTRARWDAEIPPHETWRPEAVFQALVQSSLFDDPHATVRSPSAFLAPNGTLLDLWEAFNGRPVYDPSQITCPTLLLRGGADTTSTRSDALALFDQLGTPHKRYFELSGGTHFASAERAGPEIFSATSAFLQDWGGR
ncbi:MAG: alpha/beta hydrolase [Pseudomonadota bacterium]